MLRRPVASLYMKWKHTRCCSLRFRDAGSAVLFAARLGLCKGGREEVVWEEGAAPPAKASRKLLFRGYLKPATLEQSCLSFPQVGSLIPNEQMKKLRSREPATSRWATEWAKSDSQARILSTVQSHQNQPLNKVHVPSRSLYMERTSEACWGWFA